MSWLLPDMFHLYRNKPILYVSELIGHEGPGSVCSVLEKKGWSTGLSAGMTGQGDDCNSNFFQFQCSVTLTNDGLDNVKEVISLILQ